MCAPLPTDFHVHLREDRFSETAESAFTRQNVQRYLDSAEAKGITYLGVSEHMHRFTAAREVWSHPTWDPWATDDLDAYCRFVREETPLLLGIEAEFLPDRQAEIAQFLDREDWDYVLGSVHYVGDLTVDERGDWDLWGEGADPDTLWEAYFERLAAAARSGLYDIMSHPDLIKLWGDGVPRPKRDPRRLYEMAVEAMLEGDVAIEASTAGFTEAVDEMYPSFAFLEMAVEAGCPVALSSDAHRPEELGRYYGEAGKVLAELGVREISTFAGRERRMIEVAP